MKKVWLGFVLCGLFFGAVNGITKDGEFKEFWSKNVENQGNDEELPKSKEVDNEKINSENNINEYDAQGDSVETGDFNEETDAVAMLQKIGPKDLDIEEEIDHLQSSKQDEEHFDIVEDYQYEDNQFENEESIEDKIGSPYDKEKKSMDDSKLDSKEVSNVDNYRLSSNNHFYENTMLDKNEDSLEGFGNSFVNEIEDAKPLVEPPIDKNISENFEDTDSNAKEDVSDLDVAESRQIETVADINDIISETNKLLQETESDGFEADDEGILDNLSKDQELKEKNDTVLSENINHLKQSDEEDDTLDKVYSDLNEDLEKLYTTWNKLTNDESNEEKNSDSDELRNLQREVLDYEEKYGRPYGEGLILQQREDANYYDDNFGDDFDESENNHQDENENSIETVRNLDLDVSGKVDQNKFSEEVQNKASGEISQNRADSTQNDDYENVDDDNLSQIFKDSSESKEKSEINELSEDTEFVDDSLHDLEKDIFSTKDEEVTNSESSDLLVQENYDKLKEKEISYINDALEANESNERESDDGPSTSINNPDISKIDAEVTVKGVDHLDDSSYEQLMEQFGIIHRPNVDSPSVDCNGNPGPIYVNLEVENPVEITSCNYPNAYPTNRIVDWVIEGKGAGIEFNITDLNLNGILGDYLLVKPGAVDASGDEGLLFSYHLNNERGYRFLDVNRMFMRFEARMGMPFRTGFRISMKLISHLPEESEPEPIPEASAPQPAAKITVNLGGLSLLEFLPVEEEFRQIIADMATMYINENGISPGLNTTSETAQIVSRAICNIRWPRHENCAEVMFGVPLVYEDEEVSRLNEDDLKSMWETYFSRDPFAARLRRMGITEFAIPDDGSVLLVWLVIGAGVLISVAMLAFALWRYSCFEDYTRMAVYSDTSSINEKRGLDLYPTPHQTLPPLYGEPHYKWIDSKDDSARVDIGDYTNKSFVQDDLMTLDSDEEIVRERNSHSSTKDTFEV